MEEKHVEEKKVYVRPQLVEWGTIATITAGGPGPTNTDSYNPGMVGFS